ncbi:hypothetical protein FA421_36335 [Pseudomonas aeruginosa]|nr:hypothetical protein [Pseudomonas aeruginosa]
MYKRQGVDRGLCEGLLSSRREWLPVSRCRSASTTSKINHKSLVEQFDARPTEVSALFSNTLDSARATELQEKMQSAGLPV